jgi:hypothetical protein
MAFAVTVGTAQAQNPATTASHSSLSGIQSAINHTRDAVQRRLWANRQQSQQQPAPKKPVPYSSDH